MGVLDKFTAASRARRTVTLCLDRALQSEHDKLAAGLQEAADADAQDASLADPAPRLTALVEAMEAVRATMTESQVTFTIEQLAWTARYALQAQHMPRPDNLFDQFRGYNADTYMPALIKASTMQVEDATGDVATDIPDEAWDDLFSTLSFSGVQQLFSLAVEVNDEDAAIPTSARSLLASQDSGMSLASPSPGTSVPSGSEAGSRPTSPTSTTTKKAAPSGTRRRSPSRSGTSTAATSPSVSTPS